MSTESREAASSGRVLAPVAVVLSRFPLVTETFILRELVEMRRQGVPVVLVPLLRENPPTIHEAARPWVARALHAPFLDGRVAAALLRAFARRPLGCSTAIVRALWRARRDRNAWAGTLGILGKAALGAERLEALGVRHVHAQFATHPAMAAWLIRHAFGGPPFSVTVHAHDIFVSQAGLREKLEDAAFVRCISSFNARWLAERVGVPPQRCVVIHCGIAPHVYVHRPEPGRPGLDRPARILCIAALKSYKGVVHLIDAVALLESSGFRVRCDVIGDGPLRASLERHIVEAGVSDSIALVGTRTESEVASALAGADAFALPSIVAEDGQMEGIPVALMEALATGLPVVATRLSGIPELVREGETGWLVEPGDPAALAVALRDALSSLDEAARRAGRGRALVEAEFEIRGVVQQLVARIAECGALSDAPDWAQELALVAATACGRARSGSHVGLMRWHEGRDACTVEALLPAAGSGDEPQEAVAKRHLDAPHATSPASDRALREHEALRALFEQGVAVPRPLALDAARALVVMERVDGRPLDFALTRDLGSAGAWLRSLAMAAGPGRESARFEPGVLRQRLLREAREDAATCRARGLGDRVVRSAEALLETGLARECAGAEPIWTHGDYWPGNLLVTTQGLAALDLEGLRPGFPGEDAANFLAHLALSTRLLGVRDAAEHAFIAGTGLPAPGRALRVAKLLRVLAWSPELGSPRSLRAVVRRHLARKAIAELLRP